MKKLYSKPLILLEDFVLQDSIAAGCAAKINLADSSTCSDIYIEGCSDALEAQILGWTSFGYFPDTKICESKYISTTEDGSDGICYFTAANNVFRS